MFAPHEKLGEVKQRGLAAAAAAVSCLPFARS
jgi:hypothetical protein